jgi:uncharacterized membrane protein YqjE
MSSVAGTLRRALAAACALLVARAEFAVAELAQASVTALGWLVSAVLAAVLAMLALLALTATVVMALWDRFGWYSMAALAVLYAGASIWMMLRLMRRIRTSAHPLAQTIAELAKDREALFGRRPGP